MNHPNPPATSPALASVPTPSVGETITVGGNPIVPGIGLTDPHGVVLDGRLWIYASHDFAPGGTHFVTKDWWVWSTDDCVRWTLESILQPESTFLKRPFDQCWAGFGVRKNGKHYWYLSVGPESVGVVVGESPRGPWSDPLGKPLVPKGMLPTESRDPDIFLDEDGAAYMVFGTFDYFIAKLNDDMISLAETPRPIVIDRPFGPYGAGKTDDKPALHRRGNLYYLSWCSFYAISSSPYGPFAFRGSVLDQGSVPASFRQPPHNGQPFDIWHDRHGNFFQWNNQWFWSTNDKGQPGLDEYYRNACLCYVHYRDNGDIAPVRLDAIGVGQYEATQDRIEAEDYFAAEGVEVRECAAGGFEVRGLRAGSWLKYPNVKGMPANATLTFSLSSAAPAGGTIEVREGTPDGLLLGTAAIPSTGAWERFQNVSCPLINTAGTHSLCVNFDGPTGEIARLDWWKVARKE